VGHGNALVQEVYALSQLGGAQDSSNLLNYAPILTIHVFAPGSPSIRPIVGLREYPKDKFMVASVAHEPEEFCDFLLVCFCESLLVNGDGSR
jgi:hypothetical protein